MQKNITKFFMFFLITTFISSFKVIPKTYTPYAEFGLEKTENKYCYMNATLQCIDLAR